MSELAVPTNAQLRRAIRRRRHAPLSIEALVFAAEPHPNYLSGIERGIRNPTWEKLAYMARANEAAVSTIAHDAKDDPGLRAVAKLGATAGGDA